MGSGNGSTTRSSTPTPSKISSPWPSSDILTSDHVCRSFENDIARAGVAEKPSIDHARETWEEQSSQQKGIDSGKPRWKYYTAKVLWFLQDQWFLAVLGILIAIASQVQVPRAQQQLKETVVSYVAVSVIFFITGCTLPTKVLIENYSRWKIHLFVQVQCFLMVSAITFAVVSLCATNPDFMDPWLLIGLVFAGCVPTTISSNVVMTRQAHGNTALTVVQSTIGNFLGPFLTPVLAQMYLSGGAWYTKVLPDQVGGYGNIYRRVFKQLGLSLFVPIVVGQIVQNLFPRTTSTVFARWKLNKLASLSLLTVLWSAYDQAFESGAFNSVKASNLIFIVFMSLALFVVFWLICMALSILWLPKKDTIAVAYCVPAKTPAMGIPITTTLWVGLATINESKIQIPMVIYQGFQIAAGSLLTILFRRWVRADEEKEAQSKAAAQ